MTRSVPLINCPNPSCEQPENALGMPICQNCQTSLIYRYLRPIHPQAASIESGDTIAERYYVANQQLWLDLLPGKLPQVPESLPESIWPYLRLYPQRLHVPEVYGFCQLEASPAAIEVPLLENIPVDTKGRLWPGIREAWGQATATRQVYWLWQMWDLWQPLAAQGAAASLLVANNMRVEGWRVRLLELYIEGTTSALSTKASWQQLGVCWAAWFLEGAKEAIAPALQQICQQMQAGSAPEAIATQLNQLLLEQASGQFLRLRVAGATDIGPQQAQNEDSCFPTPADLPSGMAANANPLIPYFSAVCDGIGGHEGGEVASQMALSGIKLQVQAFLREIAEQTEILSPEAIAEQLGAIVRVANNAIAARNDEQGRESRQRMATTLVMALQVPQQVAGKSNAREMYIVSVGDSRAYWITDRYCQQITVDDDVATREVRTGRSLYRHAWERPDAGALTQALGTRQAELLRPNIYRLILEEDGILLLCSDGLCDNNLVEESWSNFAEPILRDRVPLDAVAHAWLELASQKNGRDNASIALTYCRITPEYPVLLSVEAPFAKDLAPALLLESEMAASSRALLETQEEEDTTPVPAWQRWLQASKRGLLVTLGIAAILVGGGALGVLGFWLINPQGAERLRDRWLQNTPLAPETQPKPSLSPAKPPTSQPSPSK